jgi:hypothetical protein
MAAFFGSEKTLAYYRVHEEIHLDQVIEALFDLLNQNPNLSCMIVEALKENLKQSSKWQSQTDFDIDKNCTYLNKGVMLPFINY